MSSFVPSSSAEPLLRKSAHGRTELFLPTPDVLLREIKCMGGIVKRSGTSVFHELPAARHVLGAACWHCCEPIPENATVIPLPRTFDAQTGSYFVYGRTCSPGCAKAYILEHTSFDRGQHLNMLVQMLRDAYGWEKPILATPPRPSLKRFGGVLDVVPEKAECRLVEPPFLSYCMLAEEHQPHPEFTLEQLTQASAEPEAGPSQEGEPEEGSGLFQAYVEQRKLQKEDGKLSWLNPGKRAEGKAAAEKPVQEEREDPEAPEAGSSLQKGSKERPRRRKRAEAAPKAHGPIAKFVKPRTEEPAAS